MQFRFRCAAVLTAVLLCSAAALPALAEETATPETADSVASASTYTGWKTVNGKDYWYENGVKQGTTGRGKEIYDPDSDAWYWLDAKQGGAKAVSKDVYQESNGGKWVWRGGRSCSSSRSSRSPGFSGPWQCFRRHSHSQCPGATKW